MLDTYIQDAATTPQTTAKKLMALVRDLMAAPPGAFNQAACLQTLDLCLQVPRLALHVVEAVLEEAAGSQTAAGLAIAAHQQDAVWAQPYALHAQAYSPLFKQGPMLHLGILSAMGQTSWPRVEIEHLRRTVLHDGDVVHAAQVLRRDFAAIVAEAAELLKKLQEIRVLKSRTSMHVMQIETYMAGMLCAGSLRGKRCIDLGAGAGELGAYLQLEGAQVDMADLVPDSDALFGIVETPRFDMVFASALMEPGAFHWPRGVGLDLQAYNARCDELVEAAARLLLPGGYLVVRNLNHPLPFDGAALERSRLHHVPTFLPLCTTGLGGRLAVWRKL